MEKELSLQERHGFWLRCGVVLAVVYLVLGFLLETGHLLTISLFWESLLDLNISVFVWLHACILLLTILAFVLALYGGPDQIWEKTRTALKFLYLTLGLLLIGGTLYLFSQVTFQDFPPFPYSGLARWWVIGKTALYMLIPLLIIPTVLHRRASLIAPVLMGYIVFCMLPYSTPNNPAYLEWVHTTFGNALGAAGPAGSASGVSLWSRTTGSILLVAIILAGLNGYFRIGEGALRTGLLVMLIATIPIFLFSLPFSGFVSSGPIYGESDGQYEGSFAGAFSDQEQQQTIAVVDHGKRATRHYPSNNQKFLSILLATLVYALAWQYRKREPVPTILSATAATEFPAAAGP